MKVLGVTGGIGSGKSTICAVFEALGIPVFYADKVAAGIIAGQPEVRKKITETFGEDVLTGTELDRKKLASRVFGNPKDLDSLNRIIHPLVADAFLTWKSGQSAPYVVREAAVLIESNAYKQCDEVLLVTAPEELRIQRVARRDNTDPSNIRERIRRQWTDEQKKPFSTGIIVNDDKTPVLPVILSIHSRILSEG